ncbi:hypothetical protein GCM10010401_09710 [Rarobacter faecitabidus]|uniref:WD40 repeat protein n=1 Tax=Rarobacter faecitabidus TaxID=13243 RepID=A0A542ZA53_RARFA|nr:hypothetical protein [Rarobacter faecitabidus]TQL57203.1 hypothetical protein FB461_2324 [Rarobacter faecitabidus]
MNKFANRMIAGLASAALALGGAIAVGAPAATAATAPGTIVYIKNHDVWMAKGDGTGQVRVTTNGSITRYASPSMSDNGVITALRGRNIVRLKTDGTVLSSWDTGTLLPVADGGMQFTLHADASPDGSKVAYSQSSWKGMGYSVNVGSRFSASDRYTNGGPQLLFRSDPRWISNTRVLIRSYSTIYLHTVGQESAVEWFNDEQVYPGSGGLFDFPEEQWAPELSADGSRLVTMRGPTNYPQMVIYTVTGNAHTSIPAVPTEKCSFYADGDGADEFDRPTIAPNSKALAWQMSEGIYVKDDLNDCGTDDVRLVIPGASEPRWSKAPYKAPTAAPAPGSALKSTKAPSISGTAKVGKTLKAGKGTWLPAATKVTYQWKRNGKAIKGATKAAYKLKKADAGKKITVTVTASRSGYKKASKTSSAVGAAAYATKKPKLKSASAKVGKKLKVGKGKWAGKPKTYSYQWYRGKKKIKGATKATYKVTRADKGKAIRVKVIAKRKGFVNGSAYTAFTKKVR